MLLINFNKLYYSDEDKVRDLEKQLNNATDGF